MRGLNRWGRLLTTYAASPPRRDIDPLVIWSAKVEPEPGEKKGKGVVAL